MTADVHGRIAAAVAEKRVMANLAPLAWSPFVRAVCDHANKVLARHVPAAWYSDVIDAYVETACRVCDEYPCPEVRDLADLWLDKGWES